MRQRRVQVTHQQRGHPGHQRIQQHRRDGARLFRSEVRLGVRAVVAEEALNVYAEGVRVLKVIRQENRSCHDHQLEIEHGP